MKLAVFDALAAAMLVALVAAVVVLLLAPELLTAQSRMGLGIFAATAAIDVGLREVTWQCEACGRSVAKRDATFRYRPEGRAHVATALCQRCAAAMRREP